MASTKQWSEDLKLAQKICSELKACNQKAILKLFHYQNYFLKFARPKLWADKDSFNESPASDLEPYYQKEFQAESVVNKLWELLIKPRIINHQGKPPLKTYKICEFKGKSSLKTYLTRILLYKILDANRAYKKEREKAEQKISSEDLKVPEDAKKSGLDIEGIAIDKDFIRRVTAVKNEALLMLEEQQSTEDAALVRMRLKKLPYEEIARALSPGRDFNKEEMARECDRLRQRQGRAKKKLDIYLERCMKKHELSRDEIKKFLSR